MTKRPGRAKGSPSEGGVSPDVVALAYRLRNLAGGTVEAILLYGSHLLGTNPDKYSAVDLVVIVDDYRDFYATLADKRQLHRPVSLMTLLAHALPPNVLAYAPNDGRDGIAKYLLISKRDFERAVGPRPHDHFVLARMVQRVGIVWAADADVEVWLRRRLAEARGGVLRWMAPYLEGPVDAEALGRRTLEVCYRGELRPESGGRAGRVFEVQADHFREVFTPVLEGAVADGTMRRDGERYSLVRPVGWRQRSRIRRYFRRSKVRATARWLKHTITFVNWLPYIVRKVERHTGRRVELTPIERALPVLFLWPRVILVLLTRPRREIGS